MEGSNFRAAIKGKVDVAYSRVRENRFPELGGFNFCALWFQTRVFQGVLRRSRAFQNVPRRSRALHGVRRRSKTFQGAPRRSRRSRTFLSVPKRSRAFLAIHGYSCFLEPSVRLLAVLGGGFGFSCVHKGKSLRRELKGSRTSAS